MSQRDPRDPWWVPAPLIGPKPKGPIKVALAKLPGDMDVDPSVRAALRRSADDLEQWGYRVSEVEVPDINGVWQTWCDILRSFPPTLIQVGSAETLLSDATRFAAAAGSSDVDVTLEIWPHMIHAWPVWNAKLEDGRCALTKAGEFIRAHDRRL
jgi:acetyl esterase/lipase